MPLTGTALLVAIGVAFSVWGGGAAVRGAKKAAHAIAHKLHHEKPPAAPAEKD
jgi:hypothetical protein